MLGIALLDKPTAWGPRRSPLSARARPGSSAELFCADLGIISTWRRLDAFPRYLRGWRPPGKAQVLAHLTKLLAAEHTYGTDRWWVLSQRIYRIEQG